MLSSKKSTLVNCLLKKITSDVPCIVCSASSTGSCHSQRNVTSSGSFASRFGTLFEYIATKCCCVEPYSKSASCDAKSRSIQRTKRILISLSKRELNCLLDVIESGGGHVGECIFIQQQANNESAPAPVGHRRLMLDNNRNQSEVMIDHSGDDMAPNVLLCLLVRWPHMYSCQHLMRLLPWCSHYTPNNVNDIKSEQTICINPYHWSLLIPQYLDDIDCHLANQSLLQTDNGFVGSNQNNKPNCQYDEQYYYTLPSNIPPPSYSEAFAEVPVSPCSNLDRPKSSDQNCAVNSKWCFLAYWEFQNRVGQFYPVIDNSVNVYAQPVNQDGLSLEPLFNMNANVSKIISNTRNKIGIGVSVFRDSKNSVWLYNRSSASIFVNSYTLNPPSTLTANTVRSSAATVAKVQPGHLLKAYDYQVALAIKSAWNSIVNSNDNTSLKPNNIVNSSHDTTFFDFDSFRFSFVKGFGVNYVRQNVMQCPCWVEVILDFAC